MSNLTPSIDPKWGKLSRLHDPYALAHFQPRESDILIVTGPKAGTTWMQQILHQLRTGGDDSFEAIDYVVPWLEKPSLHKNWREILAEYEAMEDPRIFKTHCTYEQTPGPDTVRIILSSRDPRDCCVSFYHHLMDMTDEAREQAGVPAPTSFDAFFERWLDFAAWYRNIQSWWPHVNDTNVLWLRYEDMKKNFEATVDQILTFLDWSLNSEQQAKVMEYCSFGWMKENAHRFTTFRDSDKPMFKSGGFIRKGTVGDHKKLLTVEHEERILAKAKEWLEPECLDYIGLGFLNKAG